MDIQFCSEGTLLCFPGGHLDPAITFGCGQCFRWKEISPSIWQGIAFGKVLVLEDHKDSILLKGVDKTEFDNLWRSYFDLDRDYGVLMEKYRKDSVLAQAIAYAPGLRLLRQDGWEALCTFIISQNNRIPRIAAIIERLCTCFGDNIGEGLYAFPRPEQLAALSLQDLEPLRSGYRAEYLLDCACRVADGRLNLALLERLPLEEATQKLLEVKGVGIKVAQCALLFGFGRMECFPEDTWIKKARLYFYPHGLPDWQDDCPGIAQQYLFHYARCAGVLPGVKK